MHGMTIHRLKVAANNDDDIAQYELGNCYMVRKTYETRSHRSHEMAPISRKLRRSRSSV